MKRTATEAEETRQSLLAASLTVFLAKGYADTRIEDICEAAGVTRGAFYHYYDSKKSIYIALLAERLAPVQSLLEENPENSSSPIRKLTDMLVKVLTLMRTDKGYRDVNELILYKTGYVEELQDGMEMKKESMKIMIGRIEEYLNRASAWGEIKLSTDVHSAALNLYAALSGAMTLLLLDGGYFSFDRNPDKFVRMWLNGIVEW